MCLCQVVIDDMGNKEVYEFPVDAWFDISEGDGKIQRDVLVGATQPMGESLCLCVCYSVVHHSNTLATARS